MTSLNSPGSLYVPETPSARKLAHCPVVGHPPYSPAVRVCPMCRWLAERERDKAEVAALPATQPAKAERSHAACAAKRRRTKVRNLEISLATALAKVERLRAELAGLGWVAR